MGAEFKGLDNVFKMLDDVADTETTRKALKECCAIVLADAVKNVIDNSGDDGNGELAGSIKAKVEANGTELQGIVYTNKEYAPYVEYGTGIEAEGGNGRTWDLPWTYFDEKKQQFFTTSGQKPQPFLRPALYQNRARIVRILQGGITKND